MKRSDAIRSLSQDHQHALAVALSLRRAEDADEAARVFLRFWEAEGRDHFRVEEETLLPMWGRLGTVDDAMAARLAREHLAIRTRALSLQARPELDEARELGRELADHVRFEERELFNAIERDLGDAKLAELATAVEAAGLSRA